MDPLLDGLVAARAAWLKEIVAGSDAEAIWLAGSLGRGAGDAWSDVDLLVVGAELPLDDAVLTLEAPQNGPAGGRYVGAMYDVGSLPLWVDWYAWPADLPAPRDARLLAGDGRPGERTLFEALDHHGRGLPLDAPDTVAFTLAMVPLTAKFIARGDLSSATAMAAMLGVAEGTPLLDGLRYVLANTPGSPVVHALVTRFLDVVAAADQGQRSSRVQAAEPAV